ncbi:MAG: bifunctional nuclease family protein [Candidatus Rokubacteria bacterium]|nr:bifunctional nuclease family protein [Candidatus Rokubacteria bacterium]
MSTVTRIGLLVLSVLILLGSVGARERGETPAPKVEGPQEVEVVGMAADPRTQQPFVLMQGRRDKRRFSMAIGFAEATSIAVALEGLTPPRPLTHDLFLTMFGRLNVTLTRVVITDLRDDIYYAVVHLKHNGTEMILDSRPSDAIALAIRAKVPVLVEDRVFEKSTTPGAAAPRERI